MTDPSDDAEPAAPAGSPAPTIADHDGGVARRLTTRCRIAASVLLVFAVGCLLIGVLNDFTDSTALLLLLAAGAVAWGAMLLRRAALWSSVAASPLPSSPGMPSSPGIEAVVGPPKRLSPGVPGAPVKRRLGAKVVPIHAEVDPQPGGGALVVHARADGLELVAGDGVRAWPAAWTRDSGRRGRPVPAPRRQLRIAPRRRARPGAGCCTGPPTAPCFSPPPACPTRGEPGGTVAVRRSVDCRFGTRHAALSRRFARWLPFFRPRPTARRGWSERISATRQAWETVCAGRRDGPYRQGATPCQKTPSGWSTIPSSRA